MTRQEYKLEELIHIKHGYGFKSQYFVDSGSYILLTPGNFYEKGGFKSRAKKKYYQGPIPEGFVLKRNDLIVAMTEQAEGLLGSTAVVPEENKYLHNQRLGLITITDESKLNKQYLHLLFNTPIVRKQIRASANGTKVRHTSPSRIYSVKVDLPPLPIQNKIAAILSAYDDLIENNNRRIALLEQMAEEIYREWFVRMRFPGYEEAVFRKGVPEGWEVVKIAKAFDFIGGGTPSKKEDRYWHEGEINWFTPTDITASDGIFLSNSRLKCTTIGLNNSSAKMFPSFSVMMTSRATIGAIGINTTPACTNQGFITCIPNETYPLSYLYHWVKINKPYFEILATGSTFPELTKGTFKKINILTPPKAITNQFERLISPLFKNIELLLSKINLLKQTRDKLLSRLISGKLSVEELDIAFPPSGQS